MKAYSFFDTNNDETIMLIIEIPGFREPIFKVLDRMDFALIVNKEIKLDEMAFRERLIDLGDGILS